jgi:hypothetical protein
MINSIFLIRNIVENKRVAFVFGDPAGAKAMIAISKLFCNNNSFLLFSDRHFTFFEEMGVEVSILTNECLLFSELNSFEPQLIFTGTSLPTSIELKSLKYGKFNNINTASFVDHWTNMKKRFIDENNDLIIPDKIFVIDDNAYDLAVKDGLPKKQIVVASNPYYNWLMTWKPSIKRSSFYQLLDLSPKAEYILYAPEPLDKFNLKGKYGFNEYDILNDIDKIFKNNLKKNSKDLKVVFKPHPNISKKEVLNAINSILGHVPEYLILISNVDLNHLIYYSSFVLGFFSNSLIEASILGKSTFRVLYKLNRTENDPLNDSNVGVRIDSYVKFQEILNKNY